MSMKLLWIPIVKTSDSVTRVNDSIWLDLSHNFWWLRVDSSHVEKNGDSTRLESRFSQNDSNRLESQSMTRDSSQSHFDKISEFLMDKPSSLAHKEMRIFCFSDDQDWGKFYVLTLVVLCCILRIKSSQLTYRETWDFGFTEGSAGHNMLIPYRGSVLYLHIVIMAVGLILWPCAWASEGFFPGGPKMVKF